MKRSRFGIPQASQFEVERTALLLKLQTSQAKIIALNAPSGYGKTTLAAQYARAGDKPTVWLTLTPDDLEAYSFAKSVATLIRQNIGLNLTKWKYTFRNSGRTSSLAVSLAEDLNGAEDSLLIVFDTLEFLGEDASRWLSTFIRYLGEGHQVLMTSYGEAFNLSRFISEGDVLEIGIEDLKFSLEESQSLFKQAKNSNDIENVYLQVEGWPAALGMIAHGSPITHSVDELIENLLDRLPADLKQTLPEAAVLEVWDDQTWREVGCELPEGWLSEVKASGLPLLPLAPGIFHPHTLVREVLAKQLLKSPRSTELRLAAAKKAQSAGQLLSAVEHLAAGNHIQEAIYIIEELLPVWERHSDWSSIRKVLEPFAVELPTHLKTYLAVAYLETSEPLNELTPL